MHRNIRVGTGRSFGVDNVGACVNQSAPRLLASNLWVDDVIKGSNEWGPEQVASRGKALAALTYDKVWKL